MKLAGERRAFGAAVLGASFIYHLGALLAGIDLGLNEIWVIALSAGYGLAFLALVAGYGLARPVALAMLAVGVVRGGLGLIGGVDEVPLIGLALHVVAMLALLGRDDLTYIKLVGERRALASIVLAFYALAYAMLAMMVGGDLGPAMIALGACYGAAFFALVAGYFWARWFGVGVLLFGVIQGVLGLWQLGMEPIVVFMAGTHIAAALSLWGTSMAVPYDGQTAWREKFHMDDNAVQRLGRSVIRAGVSLPMVLLYAFAPKPAGMEGVLLGAAGLASLGLVMGGFVGMIRMRTWGVLALGASGVLLLAVTGEEGFATGEVDPATLLGGVVLLTAVLPFVRAIANHVRAPRAIA